MNDEKKNEPMTDAEEETSFRQVEADCAALEAWLDGLQARVAHLPPEERLTALDALIQAEEANFWATRKHKGST